MQIYRFNSILKPVLWGGDKLVRFKGLPACEEPIGESWELSSMPGRESVVAEGPDQGLTLSRLVQRYGADLVGEDVYHRYGDTFPLLIKFIDARRDLSVQVHPGDEQAMRLHGCTGKNEMWYVLEADEGAVIRTGFNRSLTVEEYDRRLANGTLLEVMNATSAKPGDIFFIPSGQIHSIGAGNFVVEIQQASDVTYRVWDYDRRDADGNPRQLHVDEAREALDLNARDGMVTERQVIAQGITRLTGCDDFEVCHLDVAERFRLEFDGPHSFVAMVCLKGGVTLVAKGLPRFSMCQGETALVPAVVEKMEMMGNAEVLMVTVPRKTVR